uniref:ribosomal protein S4 n=1 Tax=Prototheca fontanea TaxID=2836215 RepID=UPI003002DB53
MSRYRGPRLRILRRLGYLPGFSKKKTQNLSKFKWRKRNFRESQYSIRLKEKQKLRYNYGINEQQLINYVREARRRKGSTGEILLQLLEMRLDNIIYNLGFAPTIPAARQFINHGHIQINNKKMDIPSYNCKINDIISVSNNSIEILKKISTSNSLKFFKNSLYLELDKENLKAQILNIIPRNLIKLQINELLVIEYYSRKI